MPTKTPPPANKTKKTAKTEPNPEWAVKDPTFQVGEEYIVPVEKKGKTSIVKFTVEQAVASFQDERDITIEIIETAKGQLVARYEGFAFPDGGLKTIKNLREVADDLALRLDQKNVREFLETIVPGITKKIQEI